MVTGVETAGLVLAAFPILVDGLSHWVKGVETIRRWQMIRRELDSYALRLQTQSVTYLDTLEQLLVGIVQSNEEMTAMLTEPGGASWQNQEYDRVLQLRLDRSYAPFLATLTHMKLALNDIMKKFGIEKSGNVSRGVSSGKGYKAHEFFQIVWDNLSFAEREMKRLKIVLSKDSYSEKMDEIDKLNMFLRQCTVQNLHLEPSRSRLRARRVSKDIGIIKKHATSLFNAMIKGKCWKCRCRDFHVASLRLETRPRPVEKSISRFRIRLMLSRNQSERDTHVCSKW